MGHESDVQIRQLALDAGATHAFVVETAPLQAEEPVRASCAMNACGRYGRNWGCPPACGTLEECGARLHAYPQGVLIQNISALEDSWDFEGMEAAAKAHSGMVRTLTAQIAEQFSGAEILSLSVGGCEICEKCSYPDPCRFPGQSMSSVEGYGLDVKRLVESCGLNYINGVNTVSYVGLICYQLK